MFVVELFVPLEKPDGSAVPASVFELIKTELTDRFGGVTAHLQSPAEGAWKPEAADVIHDRVAIFEVMIADVDTNGGGNTGTGSSWSSTSTRFSRGCTR